MLSGIPFEQNLDYVQFKCQSKVCNILITVLNRGQDIDQAAGKKYMCLEEYSARIKRDTFESNDTETIISLNHTTTLVNPNNDATTVNDSLPTRNTDVTDPSEYIKFSQNEEISTLSSTQFYESNDTFISDIETDIDVSLESLDSNESMTVVFDINSESTTAKLDLVYKDVTNIKPEVDLIDTTAHSLGSYGQFTTKNTEHDSTTEAVTDEHIFTDRNDIILNDQEQKNIALTTSRHTENISEASNIEENKTTTVMVHMQSTYEADDDDSIVSSDSLKIPSVQPPDSSTLQTNMKQTTEGAIIKSSVLTDGSFKTTKNTDDLEDLFVSTTTKINLLDSTIEAALTESSTIKPDIPTTRTVSTDLTYHAVKSTLSHQTHTSISDMTTTVIVSQSLKESSSISSAGLAAAIIFPILVIILIVILCLWCCCRYQSEDISGERNLYSNNRPALILAYDLQKQTNDGDFTQLEGEDNIAFQYEEESPVAVHESTRVSRVVPQYTRASEVLPQRERRPLKRSDSRVPDLEAAAADIDQVLSSSRFSVSPPAYII